MGILNSNSQLSPISLESADLEAVVSHFLLRLTKPNDRYASFDYCYNYFKTTDNLDEDLEKSCLVLGFYLASWGMFRGSSSLLQKSLKHFERVIKYISELPREVWMIDVDTYSDSNVQTIISIYQEVKHLIVPEGKADLTLTTKVLLGVFGFVPAFDNYFTATFRALSGGSCGFRRVNTESLSIIKDFYLANKAVVDDLAGTTFTIDFKSGQSSQIHYPKAKIIDMYGFTAGLSPTR